MTWTTICPGTEPPEDAILVDAEVGSMINEIAEQAVALLAKSDPKSITIDDQLRGVHGSRVDTGARIGNLTVIRGGEWRGVHSTIAFKFNEVSVIVSQGVTANQVVDAFRSRLKEDSRLYWESPEGKAEKARQEQQRLERQAKHDAIMADLPEAVGDQTRLIEWLIEYSDVADNINVTKNLSGVIAALEAAGYRENAHVTRPGQPKADFTDPSVMAEYVVGQAISALRKGMGPHPNMTHKFGTDYLEMVAAAPVP